MSLYVITGGPGVGKTTICNELKDLGYAVVKEAARSIIRLESWKARTGREHVLPWTDLSGFQDAVLGRINTLEERVQGNAFCDRGAIDAIGYCYEAGIELPDCLQALVQKEQFAPRYKEVFLLDRLPFYKQDEQRVEDNHKAARLHENIAQAYTTLGYEVVRVPVLPPKERALYLLQHINDTSRIQRAG
jgi:predicted ATPase